MNLMPLGFLASGRYYFGLLGTGKARSVAVDSVGNLYVAGYASVSSVSGTMLVKYNPQGELQWQRRVSGAVSGTLNEEGYAVAVDASDNVYVAGYTYNGTSVHLEALLVKYNSSGSIQWQRRIGGSSYDVQAFALSTDSSSNIYVSGMTTVSGNGDFLFAKYNSSGVIQWQRKFGGANQDQVSSSSTSGAGDTYLVGYTQDNATGYQNFQIAKYNTSGALQWQRKVVGSNNDLGNGSALDASGNLYIVGSSYITGSYSNIILMKYNSSGVLQWQRKLVGAGPDEGYDVAVDAAGDIYLVGSTDEVASGAPYKDILLAKYNSSGAIQWQYKISSAVEDLTPSISVNTTGELYVAGYNGSTGSVVIKYPATGGKLGTYNVSGQSYTISVATLTESDAGMTDSASTLTSSTTTSTESALTVTDSATTFTWNKRSF